MGAVRRTGHVGISRGDFLFDFNHENRFVSTDSGDLWRDVSDELPPILI